jgi:hypothetical protein
LKNSTNPDWKKRKALKGLYGFDYGEKQTTAKAKTQVESYSLRPASRRKNLGANLILGQKG